MKKLTIALVTAGLILGSGTAVFAATNGSNGQGILNFGQMLPYMQQVHPNLSTSQLKDMYNACTETGGAAPSKNFQSMNPQNQAMMQ